MSAAPFSLACVTCSAPPGTLGSAAGWAVILMLGVMLPVFGGIIAFIIYLGRKSKLAAANPSLDQSTL